MRRILDPSTIVTLVLFLILIIALVLLVPSMDRFVQGDDSRQVAAITDTIKHTLVQCYALEGAYPPDLEYLTKHYGLMMDEEKYFYYYEFIGANIPPNIWVEAY